ncbi:hypothetical protein [Aeromicrobium ginsengisoli]|uniref:LPXTG cell wall anchor domain-containing protein n=1 Tax=Aeromicrobium ginsengisoli TaxID=363867 RepID=A0A5M4FHZ7_9ACTN|nr:hypothetical protein [Aeromicrobium ginsengisoli]KAA1399225.1 hypothetical protein ESP70_000150 [Aeromicrobium ginsengisoli]
MNATIRNLIVAVPLATAALTMVPAAAMATEPGPVIIVPPHTDPQPDLDIKAPAPKPEVPEDKAPAPKPADPKGPGNLSDAPKPEGPDDKVGPAPKPNDPKGPGDLTNPEPCPTHGVDCTPDSDEPNDGDDGESKNSVDDVVDTRDTVELPNRIDAGLASEQQDAGLDLAWLFAGGLAVTASGAAFAVRRRTRGNA